MVEEDKVVILVFLAEHQHFPYQVLFLHREVEVVEVDQQQLVVEVLVVELLGDQDPNLLDLEVDLPDTLMV